MKIAMIGQKGMPAHYGGVEKHVHDLAIHLVNAGHDIYVYNRTWYAPTKEKSLEGVNLIYTPTLHTKHFDAITHTLTATIHALFGKYDVIHYHGVGPALLSWIPRIFAPQTMVVTTFHSIDRYHQKWNIFAKFILRIGERAACLFAHKTITVSQSLKQYCINEFDVETIYIPNGVNTIHQNETSHTLKHFGLEKDNYVVMVSRLVPHKGAHLLIEAFHNLKKHHIDDPEIKKLKLAIVGGSVYTNDYVRQLHTQAGNVNDIIFTDFQSGIELEELYRNAKALIHPSLNEGLPITVLQAMSYGKAVLVSTIPEHLEIIHDPRMLFRENDVDSIEQALYSYLNMSKEDQRQVEQENKHIIDESYSWDVVTPQIERVYKEYMNKKKRNRDYAKAYSA